MKNSPKFYLLTLLDLKGLLDRKKEVDVHPDALFQKKTHPDTPFWIKCPQRTLHKRDQPERNWKENQKIISQKESIDLINHLT